VGILPAQKACKGGATSLTRRKPTTLLFLLGFSWADGGRRGQISPIVLTARQFLPGATPALTRARTHERRDRCEPIPPPRSCDAPGLL